jgi:uncharacterized protein YgiM (DUF1202 family)
MRLWQKLTLPLMVVASTVAFAQSNAAVTKRATELRDGPASSARVLANLPADTALTRLPSRQSAWVEVRAPNGDTGWVHMFDVGAPNASTAPSNAATGALRGLTNFFTRGNQVGKTTTVTATTGIRGLGAEDIAQAQPNLAALTLAESYRQNAAQAQRFAANASLTARQVQPLPLPIPPQPRSQDDPNLR